MVVFSAYLVALFLNSNWFGNLRFETFKLLEGSLVVFSFTNHWLFVIGECGVCHGSLDQFVDASFDGFNTNEDAKFVTINP